MNISICVPLHTALSKSCRLVGFGFFTIRLDQLSLEPKLQNSIFMQIRDLNYHKPAIKREEKN